MKIEVSNGEIADKVSILIIKSEKITDEDKLVNIKKELDCLRVALDDFMSTEDELFCELKQVNEELWIIEDNIRKKEKKKEFNNDFLALARSVYHVNDRRSEIKKKIDLKTGSRLTEEKSYEQY